MSISHNTIVIRITNNLLTSVQSVFLAALFCSVLVAIPAAARAWDEQKLWFERPAEVWTEALPVGNGRLGAMCFGGVVNARIQLNEESIWAGPPTPQPNPKMRSALPRARQAWFAGDYVKAHLLMQPAMSERIAPRSHQTLGDLRLQELPQSGDRTVINYRRELDLDTAIATTSFVQSDVNHQRQVFTSAVDNVLVVRLEADQPGQISVRVTLDRPADFETVSLAPHVLEMSGQAQHDGDQLGVKWQTRLEVVNQNGRCVADGNSVRIENADALTLYLAAATDYNPDDPSVPLDRDMGQVCAATLARAVSRPYSELLRDHVTNHRELFRRCHLDLGDDVPPTLPTDKRLAALKQGVPDPALAALYFQFGRYLLISSSRPGDLPSNLQGIWNDKIDAPWNADYHVNINTQMHYWPAEITGLSECHEPFFWLTERLIPSGRRTADEMFGCRGATAGHTTDVWLWTAVFGKLQYGMWPHGFGWNSQHFMEHFRFTGDVQFLRDRTYPVLKEASLFYLDYLTTHPQNGQLVAGPDTSPENIYRGPDRGFYSVSMGPSMSQQIVWDVFTNTLEAAEILGVNDTFVSEVRAARTNLYEPRVGPDGRLMEWIEPFAEQEPGHRHISHLYAVHPGRQYNAHTNPELVLAARKSIDFRLSQGGGHTGWSRAWIINFFARFHDGAKAHEHLTKLLSNSTLENLFDTHPPFQIDGNFGGTAAIAEMLLQSHVQRAPPRGPYEIELLPALPKLAWPHGSVRGLRARGGFEVDIEWDQGHLRRATFRSLGGRHAEIRYADRVTTVEITPGNTLALDGQLRPVQAAENHE